MEMSNKKMSKRWRKEILAYSEKEIEDLKEELMSIETNENEKTKENEQENENSFFENYTNHGSDRSEKYGTEKYIQGNQKEEQSQINIKGTFKQPISINDDGMEESSFIDLNVAEIAEETGEARLSISAIPHIGSCSDIDFEKQDKYDEITYGNDGNYNGNTNQTESMEEDAFVENAQNESIQTRKKVSKKKAVEKKPRRENKRK